MKMDCLPIRDLDEALEAHDEKQETKEVYFVASAPTPPSDNPGKCKKKKYQDYFEPAQPQDLYGQGQKFGKEKLKDPIIEFVNKAYQGSNKK